MVELKQFNIDENSFYEKKKFIKECRIKNIKNTEENICANCANVFYCDDIKEYVNLQFKMAIEKLKLCQRNNNLNSCMNCDLFFECNVRKKYVNATYEKMNEGRGGQFDF